VIPTEQIANTASTLKAGLFALLGAFLHIPGIGAPNPTHTQPRSVHGQGGRELNQTGDQDLTDRATSGRQAHFARPCLARGGVAGITTTLLVSVMALVSLAAALPASASAYATPEGPPIFSAAPGLPDGRVYEQVSPADKNGNQAGASTNPYTLEGFKHYGLAAANGNSVLFEGTGSMGESPWGASELFVASKNTSAAGWSTRALLPRAQQSIEEIGATLNAQPTGLDPSADLSHVMFVMDHGSYAPPPFWKCEAYALYLAGSDPFVAATWLERPTAEGVVEACAPVWWDSAKPIGGTPDFGTVYFTYAGTLLPQDAERARHAENGQAWGFYEDSGGVLREAGVLPDGDFDQFGAVPAVSGHEYALTGNQVSTATASDGAPAGSRAFFVSPDPASCVEAGAGGENDCAVDPPELYVRENGAKTVLVSRDTPLSEADGRLAAAPGGVLEMFHHEYYSKLFKGSGRFAQGSYVFASPDGSQAFFQSNEALTKPAEALSPGAGPKTYDFDVDTGSLTYLPNVVGEIVVADRDGSSLAFVRPESGSASAELDLWTAGPEGGSVTPVTVLPKGTEGITDARMSTDGSVLVFATSGLPGYNDGAYQQIFRYAAATNSLGCVSCAPSGVTPAGSASMSLLEPDSVSDVSELEAEGEVTRTVQTRGISANGDRVFFDTPSPLVPQDTNTDSPKVEVTEDGFENQGRDVYEWENGVIYLISGGKSSRDSYLLDNSENGEDVFFATTQGLVPGDTDAGYDVYDARIPHEGEPYPPAAVPCEGAVCQGPPNVPTPLTPPASATFSGLGNPQPEPATAKPATTKAATKTVKCKKGYVKKKNKCLKKTKPKKSAKGSK
jgi:hypothetical protein